MKLFEPISIGELTLKNRLVFPPLETNYATDKGCVTQRLLDHYERIAKGGVGLIVVQATNVNPDPALTVTRFVLGIYEDRLISELQKVVEVIHEGGSLAVVQLVDKSLQAKRLRPVDLRNREVQDLINYFVKASIRAQRAGFDGVDFHMAHMYTLADFLSRKANRRLDEYGKGIEGRARIATDILQQTREAVGKRFILIPRFSGDEFVIGGNTLKQTTVLSKILEASGADILDVSAGGRRDETEDKSGENSYSAHRSVPREYMPDGVNVYIMEAIKKASNIPVIAVGKIKSEELGEEILKGGKADLIAMGRQLFADPDFPRKIQEGRKKEVIPCLSCRYCQKLFFKDKPIECVQRQNKLHNEGVRLNG